MIIIYHTKKAFNKFSLLPLKEKSIAELKMFEPELYDDINYEKLMEVWEVLYELEYKYNMIKTKNFSGFEQRRDNILLILEKTSRKVINVVGKTLLGVFNNWLNIHALNDPEKWAEGRLMIDGEDIFKTDNFKDIFLGAMAELSRYNNISEGDAIAKVVIKNPYLLDSYFQDYVKDMGERMREDLDYEGFEKFTDIYKMFIYDRGIEINNQEDAEEFIDNYFSSYDKDFFNIMGGEKEAISYLIEDMVQLEMFSTDSSFFNSIDEYYFMFAFLKDIVFPEWYGYWKAQGIDQTRDKIEDITNQLNDIEKYSLEKAFALINIAKNTSHQNGSMMEYYEERWGIDYVYLKNLSDMDVTEWNNELEEIGVIF